MKPVRLKASFPKVPALEKPTSEKAPALTFGILPLRDPAWQGLSVDGERKIANLMVDPLTILNPAKLKAASRRVSS